MNTALDNFISSIPVEVNAYKYHNQSIPLDTHRFTCPACGEYVGLVINGFFRHGKRTDESVSSSPKSTFLLFTAASLSALSFAV